MKKRFVSLLLFFPFLLLGQSSINLGRVTNDTLPKKYLINIPSLREHIYNGIPSYSKTGKYEKMTYKFADLQAKAISEFISDGKVYSDWDELESYLNEVLRQIVPPELSKDSVLHAYVYQDGDFNASMTSSGHFFINIGLLSSCSDEASLAAVMAHELAHYYKRHSLNYFIQNELGNFNNGMFNRINKGNIYSVDLELEADSLAMIWLANSKYSLHGLLRTFKAMEWMENRIVSRMKYKFTLEESTHPLSEERYSNFSKFYKKNYTKPGELYVVSKEKFLKFKEESKYESLKYLMRDFSYYQAMETAFKFHLMDPNNTTYVYYLMETIRKICYMDRDTWNENFITNRYYDTLTVNSVKKKFKVENGLFDKLDFKLLPLNQEESKGIKARFYWEGEQKFKTYEEAFIFYSNVANAINCTECILTDALSYTKNKEIRDSLLTKYLAQDTIRYRKYANNLLSNTINKELENKKLFVLTGFNNYVKQGKEKIPLRPIEKDTIDIISDIFKKVVTYYEDRIPINLSEIKNYNLNEYNLLNELDYISWTRFVAKGEKTQLHILEPRYIDIFYKYKVNEIEFLYCSYYESRAANNDIEKYKEIVNTSVEELLTKEKSTKSFEVQITALREMDNKRMKIRDFSWDSMLKFKEPSYDQIIQEMKYRIKDKEKDTFNIDVNDEKGW